MKLKKVWKDTKEVFFYAVDEGFMAFVTFGIIILFVILFPFFFWSAGYWRTAKNIVKYAFGLNK